MLIGPVLFTGILAMANRISRREACNFSDLASGFSRASGEMLAIALVFTLLFMVRVTDVATAYGFSVGRVPKSSLPPFLPAHDILSFMVWSSVLSALLAFVILAISAFSVPLSSYQRAGLVKAIQLSVKAVFANLIPSLVWATILAVSIIGSILVISLPLVVFPVLAFATHALYRELFPDLLV